MKLEIAAINNIRKERGFGVASVTYIYGVVVSKDRGGGGWLNKGGGITTKKGGFDEVVNDALTHTLQTKAVGRPLDNKRCSICVVPLLLLLCI
jgi:hypothetical protein